MKNIDRKAMKLSAFEAIQNVTLGAAITLAAASVGPTLLS